MLEKVYIKYKISFIHLKLKERHVPERSQIFFNPEYYYGARMYSDRLISRGRQPRPDMTANWQLSSEVIRPRTRGESEKIRATLTTTGMVSGKFAWGRITAILPMLRPGAYTGTYGINPRRFYARRLTVSVDRGWQPALPGDTSNGTVRKVPVLSHLAAYLCATGEEPLRIVSLRRLQSSVNKICRGVFHILAKVKLTMRNLTQISQTRISLWRSRNFNYIYSVNSVSSNVQRISRDSE